MSYLCTVFLPEFGTVYCRPRKCLGQCTVDPVLQDPPSQCLLLCSLFFYCILLCFNAKIEAFPAKELTKKDLKTPTLQNVNPQSTHSKRCTKAAPIKRYFQQT